METNWYLLNDNRETCGPFSETDIIEFISSGQLGPDVYVWNESMPDWQIASECTLDLYFPKSSPPPPPPPCLPPTAPPGSQPPPVNHSDHINTPNSEGQSPDDSFKSPVLWTGYIVIWLVAIILIISFFNQTTTTHYGVTRSAPVSRGQLMGVVFIAILFTKGWEKLTNFMFDQR